MRHSLTAIVLVLVGTVVVPVAAQETDSTPSVIRVEECQIILASERLLASGQSGIVSRVHVREGDRVREGQLLAELDASVSKATLAIAAKQAENDVNVRFARAAAKVARAEYGAAEEANRIQPNAFTPIQMEKLRLEAERSILQTEVSEHEFEVNRLRRDEATALVDSYRILAPMNGKISDVFKYPGEAVQVGESLLECRSTDKIHVEAHVDMTYRGKITKGQTVSVHPNRPNPEVQVKPQEVEGTVFFVSDVNEPVSRTMRVLVEVDNRSHLLVAGTEAVLHFSALSASAQHNTAQLD